MKRGTAIITSPQVPRYERTERITPLRTPRAQGVGPDAFGAGAARGLGQAANVLGQFAQKEQDEFDAMRVNSAQADYEAWKVKYLLDDEKGLLTANTGEGALGLEKTAIAEREKYVNTALNGLGNERQKKIFRSYLEKDRSSYLLKINRHEYEEGQKVKLTNSKAATVQLLDSVQALAATPSFEPREFNEQLDKLLDKVNIQAAFEGFSPGSEYAQALRQDYLSRAHASRIGYLMQVNPSAASGYLDAVEGEMNQKITAPLREALRPMVEEQEIEIAVNEVFSEASGATRDELIAAARQKFQGRPWLSKAEAGIRRLHADREAGEVERIEEAERAVFSHLAKVQLEGRVPTRADVPAQVWANLAITAPERVVAITDSLRSKTGAGSGSGGQGTTEQLTTWGLLKTDPGTLAKANLDALLLEGKITGGQYKDLITDQQGISQGKGGEYEAKLLSDQSAVNLVLEAVGITRKKRPEDYAKFMDSMYSRMKAFQTENGRPPKQADITDMARGLLRDVSQDRNWWPFDRETPLFMAEADKVRVPKEERKAIERALQRHGLPVTDESIGGLYLARLRGETLPVMLVGEMPEPLETEEEEESTDSDQVQVQSLEEEEAFERPSSPLDVLNTMSRNIPRDNPIRRANVAPLESSLRLLDRADLHGAFARGLDQIANFFILDPVRAAATDVARPFKAFQRWARAGGFSPVDPKALQRYAEVNPQGASKIASAIREMD